MSKYQFTSPAAAFSDAIEQALVQREVLKRQAMLDELTQRRTEAEITGADANRQLAQSNQQLARDQFDYRQQRDTTEDQFRDTQARTAAQERADAAEANRAFMAGQNEENRKARAEQAQHDRELKELIARMGASNSAESRAMANQLKSIQVQTAQDKLDTSRSDRAKANASSQTDRQNVYGLAQELLNDPALNQAVGPVDAFLPSLRPSTRDFNSRVDRLKNMLTFENRGKLKGQGAISDAETKMLEAAATSLNPAAGEDAFKRELQRIMDATGAGAGPKVLKYNPATGKVE